MMPRESSHAARTDDGDPPAALERRAVDPVRAERVGVDAERNLAGLLREAERRDGAFVGRRPHQAAVDRAEAAPQLGRALRRQQVVDADGGAERVVRRGAQPLLGLAARRVTGDRSEGGRADFDGRVLLRRALRLSRLRAAGIALAASRRAGRLAAAVVVAPA